MQDPEAIRSLPPTSEGGPKSSELLPVEGISDFDQFTDTVLALIERQTGIDVTADKTLALSLESGPGRIKSDKQWEEFMAYQDRRGRIEHIQITEPLASSATGGFIRASIEPDKVNYDIPVLMHELSISPKNSAYIEVNRIVGQENLSGGKIVFQRSTGKDLWVVYVTKKPNEAQPQIRVTKNHEEIQDQRTGFLGTGKRIPKNELARQHIGDTIDSLPARGSFVLNEKYQDAVSRQKPIPR